MSYTEQDLYLLKLHNKSVRMKVDLLNENYAKIDSLVGRIVSVSYDIASSSDIRRTANLNLAVDNASYLELDFEKTWIKRMVELSCGIYNPQTKEYVWYALGRMLMASGKTEYDATSMNVNLSLVDLMGYLTENRGSQLGHDHMVEVDSNVRNAIRATIAEYSPFKRTSVPEFEDTVPYDITVNMGGYPIEILKTLLNLYPYYEMFYDKDGVFIVQEIPTKISDPIDLPKEVVNEILISEDRSIDFSKVKNTTEVWGRELDATYTALNTTSTGSRYDVYISNTFEALTVGETYMIVPPVTSVAGQTMKIQDTTEYAIYKQLGNGTFTAIDAGAMEADRLYVIMYVDEKFVLQGEAFVHAIVQEIDAEPSERAKQKFKEDNNCNDVRWVINPDSPFACTEEPNTHSIERQIKQVLFNGEYEDIYTTQLAIERAGYENWKKTRLQDTMTLEMLLVPWLDVNDKLEYTSPTNGDVTVVLVQSIDYDFEKWTMSVKASRFYPYYPFTD